MHHVLVIGAGKIGSLITYLLAHSNHYFVHLADIQENSVHTQHFHGLTNYNYVQLDATDDKSLTSFIKKNKITTVISSLPFYCNKAIATLAAGQHLHYFDLTEDVATTQTVKELAKHAKSAFVPQCGLAPGFINIIANHLMKKFDTLDSVKIRVGALPMNTSHALQYALTWSTDGLINEYGNPCQALENGILVEHQPLEGLEEIKIDGLTYEAFNTSGGIGSLVESYAGKVKNLNYKTIRYPGHCAKIKFLMNDLKLNTDRDTLKHILENAIPKTNQDVVLTYVSVTGMQGKQFIEENDVRKFYPKKINGHSWSAIQLTTAAGICAIIDLVLQQPEKHTGFVRQEQFSFDDFLQNQFGKHYV